ncbi:MAG TPA: VOC family protein [Bacteroidota bacterium]|nr:VOC family protein [Bacteroidota bacterium]
MELTARYVHTNLIAKDWQSLSKFYVDIFGCVPVPPERHLSGDSLDRGTGISGARLEGVHLQLPGHSPDGPTLELYTYNRLESKPPLAVNRPGFGHIAFEVDDVKKARELVLQYGGKAVGEVVTLEIALGKKVTWCYVTDPEGNVIELQSWE